MPAVAGTPRAGWVLSLLAHYGAEGAALEGGSVDSIQAC